MTATTTARVFAELRATHTLPGHDPVRIPGDGRNAAYTARATQAIALRPRLRQALDSIAAELALDPL